MPVRAPGKDLVPEQEDEVEEGAQAPQHQNPLLQLGLVNRLRSPAASAATAAAPDQIRPAACPYAVRCQPIVGFFWNPAPQYPRLRWQITKAEFDGPILSILHTVFFSPCLCHWAPVMSLCVPCLPARLRTPHISLKSTFYRLGGN